MISEVSNELFTLCEDAVNEIVTAFIETMRRADSDEETVIEKTVAGLSLPQRFTISSFIMELSEDVADIEDNPLPDDNELKGWFRDQWQCAREDAGEY